MLRPSLDNLPSDFLISLDNMDIITVTGEETDKYIQGQLTCDVSTLDDVSVMQGAHCDHKGKMWAIYSLFRIENGIQLISSKDSCLKSVAELRKYGVFSKITIADNTDGSRFFYVSGESALNAIYKALGLTDSNDNLSQQAGTTIISQDSNSALIITSAEQGAQVDSLGITLCDQSLWQGLQTQQGQANLYGDTVNEFVPQMLNLQALDAISFTKGCYAGQETVARMKYLGKLKRKTFIIKGNHTKSVAPNDDLEMELSEDRWRKAGTLLQSYTDDNGVLSGLAVLPSDLEESTKLRFKLDPDSTLVIGELPYQIPKD